MSEYRDSQPDQQPMTTDKKRDGEIAERADHETIWLEPKCTEYGGNDRHWAPDNPWGESCDECEEKPVKFIRFDLHEAQLATLRQQNANLVRLESEWREKVYDLTQSLSAAEARERKAIDDLCRWRSAFQSCTPGGSEFMTPESVHEYMTTLKRETVEAKMEAVRLTRAARASD